jgi:hypothetical protein
VLVIEQLKLSLARYVSLQLSSAMNESNKVESSGCRFTVKPKKDGKPVLQLELFHRTVPHLEGLVIQFDLLSGATMADARRLAETMNERIIGISLGTPEKLA